jgi:putative SOS response-associated peptidase YedK
VPFSDAAVTGVTLIVVFYHDSSLAESTGRVAQVNFGDGSMSLITDASGKANFNIGGSASAPPEQRMQTVLADSARLDTTVPTLAMASWSKDGRIIVRMINARGETASGTGNKHSPVKSLHNICLAGDGYWSFRDQGNNTVPFYGGIAELRLYNQAVSQSEMQALEKELAGYYFP